MRLALGEGWREICWGGGDIRRRKGEKETESLSCPQSGAYPASVQTISFLPTAKGQTWIQRTGENGQKKIKTADNGIAHQFTEANTRLHLLHPTHVQVQVHATHTFSISYTAIYTRVQTHSTSIRRPPPAPAYHRHRTLSPPATHTHRKAVSSHN